jgi:anti-sigma regulatory factor (Ser/Thr protein kinase)
VDPLRQSCHRRFAVSDSAGPALLREALAEQAVLWGASQETCSRAQLVASELVTNLLQQGLPGGYILMRPLAAGSIELIAVDGGPGVADPGAALAGHVSAPGGAGRGLVAACRASGYFDLYTEPGRGTAALFVIDMVPDGRKPQGPRRRACAAVSVGIAEPCGDGWAVIEEEECAVAVVDGLGHGPAASTAADAAIAEFAAAPADLAGFVSRANAAMLGTRGGAVTVCRIRPSLGRLEYVAVGNVNGRVLGPSGPRSLVTLPGAIGLHASPPKAGVSDCPWPPGSTLILWTDGLDSHVGSPPLNSGLLSHDPAVIAAVMLRDHGRGVDDRTVVVVRPGGPS